VLSFFSFGRGKILLKKALLICLALSLLWAAFAGCDTGTVGEDDGNIPGTLPAGLAGTWEDFDSFTIDTTATPATLEYNDGGYGFGYKGNIVFVSNYDSGSGIIIVQYTTPPTEGYINGRNYHGVYYRELTSDTVKLANTTNLSDYSSVDTVASGDAINKFTKGKMGDYVDWSYVPPYVKQ